jgi:hypothetical protein
LKCEVAIAMLSDDDGHVTRRRDLRAHLRDCPDCRAFAEEIRRRGETLAAIAPMPALAAAAVLKGALASTAGSGVTADGAAGGVGAAAIAGSRYAPTTGRTSGRGGRRRIFPSGPSARERAG